MKDEDIEVSCLLGKKWLGHKITPGFVKEIKQLDKIDLCGEKGEYHTLVFDGPIFKKKIKILKTKKIKKDNHWFLNISQYCLEEKK